ncbi:MAG TPA: hypothetical protein VK402_04875 [Blastococcus sp.]|nr:hypothetical protein [Blastococcus sp.]
MSALLATATAKLLSLSLSTQAAAGLGVALASVTAAGAAGVLPDVAQDRVAGVIEAVTPFDVPDSADVSSSDISTSEDAAEIPEVTVESPDPAVVPSQAEFGRSISEQAQSGDLTGSSVSTQARATHQRDTPAADPATRESRADVPVQPETGRPDTVPAPASQSAERVPEDAGRP